MNLNELIDDLSELERLHGGNLAVHDQTGHQVDGTKVDGDNGQATTVVLITR